MHRSDLGYDLPEHLIAQEPAARRDEARLLLAREPIAHHRIRDLPTLLPQSLFVFNNTKVIPARLLGQKPTGGKVEVLLIEPLEVERPESARWLAMTKSSKRLVQGTELEFEGGGQTLRVTLAERRDDGKAEVVLEGSTDIETCLEAIGVPPLPPYIARQAKPADHHRYQTVFASVSGAIAAPTAGLHFTEELLRALDEAGHQRAEVTLHVGPGTFAPLRSEKLDEHPMHGERFFLPEATVEAIERARAAKRPVIAVGTTVVRTLEAAADTTGKLTPGEQRTHLFIYPPYEFRVVDGILTNFHLPYSTLLALVMAKLGVERTRAVYAEAVRQSYRFFSYGDAMLIPP